MRLHSCILKVTSFCNLNCSYCYMFNLGDRTFESVPLFLGDSLVDQLLERIADYVGTSREPFLIALHGGEPSLWPVTSFSRFAESIEALRARGLVIEVSLQTNLYRPLPAELLPLLRRLGIRLGVSLDGPPAWNDRHRVNHAGRGSSAAVLRNVARLVGSGDGDLLGGFLAVANPDIPPGLMLEWLDGLPVRRADVLWPIGYNRDDPPWAEVGLAAYRRAPRYGRWMAELFERWWERDDPTLHIRSFHYAVQTMLGGERHPDSLVNDTLDMFVVNTDGRVEYPDYLRATAAGSRDTGLNIRTHSLFDIEREPIFQRLLRLRDAIPGECLPCEHRAVCGGGFLAGRASSAAPITPRRSVLCYDQRAFFDTVSRLVRAGIAGPEMREERFAAHG